jgi:predicted transcriptional regulator
VVDACLWLPRWYTILKYTKPTFLQDLEEREPKPKRRNIGVALAVILLATSALTLPLTSFGVAAVSAYSGNRTVPAVTIVVVQQIDQSHGKAVLDGVASMFVVAPPLAEGAPQKDEFGTPEGSPPAGGLSAVIVVNSSIFHGFFHAQDTGFWAGSSSEQGQGFGPSGPWLPNGGVLRTGPLAETILVPSPSAVSSVTAAVPKVWWDFFQRRSKFEIYVDILELMKRGPMTPFEVAFYARLNHKRTKEYTEFLAEAGYLHPVNEDGRNLYVLTKEGIGFLDRVQSLLVGPGIIEVASADHQRDF